MDSSLSLVWYCSLVTAAVVVVVVAVVAVVVVVVVVVVKASAGMEEVDAGCHDRWTEDGMGGGGKLIEVWMD